MNYFKNAIAILILFALLCTCFTGCNAEDPSEVSSVPTAGTEPSADTEPAPTETLPAETEPAEPVDISTTGGVVIVGTVSHDESGWFLIPEQPLNVEFHYFLDNPSQFDMLTRIELYDPKIDGIEKLLYLGKTVTVEGTLSFYRDSFDKLYMLPYAIYFGKTVPESYAAADLQAPDLTQSKYDPSIPLPEQMKSTIDDGRFVYNPYMLSLESLELMGNDFATFYCDFVDAFLNYRPQCPCPSEEYAQMLSTIIFFEFPLYDICAQSFEFTKHYDPAQKAVTIAYKYDQPTHQQNIDAFLVEANTFLSTTSTQQTQGQLAQNIYHELCTRMTYDDSALIEFERKNAYYAYMNHSGVCVTFANVYNQLLTQVGIQATTAQCDYTLTMGHVWSLVTIDGVRYFCDPTFELNFKDGTAYAYFCQTYAQRLDDGLGANGITAGRYYPYYLDESMLSSTTFPF